MVMSFYGKNLWYARFGIHMLGVTLRAGRQVQHLLGVKACLGLHFHDLRLTERTLALVLAAAAVAGGGAEQRIGVEEAIRIFTLGSAFASFEESIKGSIEPGKLADLVILELASTPAIAQRAARAETIWEAIFPTIMMGDDRAVTQTWIAGKPMKPEKTEG